MPNLLSDCKDIFSTDNLYVVLGTTKEASKQQLKKAYHKKSLAYHPDRSTPEEKDVATHKFQILGQVYSILSDDSRRAEYDETGCVDDEAGVDQDRNWEEYWRLLFPKVTAKDIQEFADKYRGSKDELEDLKNVYLSSEGDMETILNTVLCCTYEDEARFTDILRGLIDGGELPDFDKFSKETTKKKNSRLKQAKAEAKEAEEAAKKLKLDGSEDSLMAAIAQRQASRAKQADDFLSQLEAKYSNGGGVKKGTKKSKR